MVIVKECYSVSISLLILILVQISKTWEICILMWNEILMAWVISLFIISFLLGILFLIVSSSRQDVEWETKSGDKHLISDSECSILFKMNFKKSFVLILILKYSCNYYLYNYFVFNTCKSSWCKVVVKSSWCKNENCHSIDCLSVFSILWTQLSTTTFRVWSSTK